ncbi:hypothetical protein ACFFHJ_00975 [Planotetraspora thailandica]|nr:hypothetical protein [Planotetraspora thailandica]
MRTAAAGAAGTAIVTGGLFAIAAQADTKTVAYVCAPSGPATATASPNLTVALNGPTGAIPSQAVTLTWVNQQPSGTDQIITAPAAIPAGDRVVIVGDLIVAGPSPAGTRTVQATATGTPAAEVASGSPVPLPTLTALVTPTATGTISVKADKFTLGVGPSGSPTTWYSCSISTTAAANTTAAALSIKVTPQTTRTVYVTETAQVTETPEGGAATGGGGEAGPDGRLFLLTGSALVLAAAGGGLVLRARRRAVRH